MTEEDFLKATQKAIPPELLQLCDQIHETILAAGIRMDDAMSSRLRVHFIMGVSAALCYVQEPDTFPHLKARMDQVLMESLTSKG